MFLGAAIAELFRRRQQVARASCRSRSGVIAGESLMGVLIIILTKIAGLNLTLF